MLRTNQLAGLFAARTWFDWQETDVVTSTNDAATYEQEHLDPYRSSKCCLL